MKVRGSQYIPYAWSAEGPKSLEELWGHAKAVASELPDFKNVVNLCEDRYLFSVGFVASLLRGQITLLPPSRQESVAKDMQSELGDFYCLVDRGVSPPAERPHYSVEYVLRPGRVRVPPLSSWVADWQQPVVIAFTSGSTGLPQPHYKTWRTLIKSTQMALRRFELDGYHMVATVPAQHMYGLECSVLYPLLGRVTVYSGRPFFPEDIRTALDFLPGPRVLVTSPLHLRACLGSGLKWPKTDLLLSATGPLPLSLAAEVERVWDTRVREIYGCTEAGAIASRDTTATNCWALYDGMRLQMKQSWAHVRGPQLDGDVRLPDVIRKIDDTHFELVGRAEDQINVGGKRASLAELNSKLLAIDGVDDGVILMCESDHGGPVVRPVALVVAPLLDETLLRARLGEVMPAIFVPRPIYFVTSLPRNATGKLPRNALKALLDAQRREPSARSEKKSNSPGGLNVVKGDDTETVVGFENEAQS